MPTMCGRSWPASMLPAILHWTCPSVSGRKDCPWVFRLSGRIGASPNYSPLRNWRRRSRRDSYDRLVI